MSGILNIFFSPHMKLIYLCANTTKLIRNIELCYCFVYGWAECWPLIFKIQTRSLNEFCIMMDVQSSTVRIFPVWSTTLAKKNNKGFVPSILYFTLHIESSLFHHHTHHTLTCSIGSFSHLVVPGFSVQNKWNEYLRFEVW